MTVENVTEEVTDEVKETESASGSGSDGADDLSSKSPDELASMIRSLRKENASKRVANRETQQKLSEYEEWKRSQMSEAEKLKADLERAVAERQSDWIDLYCEKYNVPEDSRDLVKGSSREDIERLAKALGVKDAQRVEEEKPRNPNLFPGTRGSAVGSTGKNINDFDAILREQLLGK